MRGSPLVSTLLLLASLAAAKPQNVAPRSGCQVEATNYKGWQAQQISNAWVKLITVPQNGGRLMQVVFDDHEYLFVNPQYAGKNLPPDETKWFNYGGDKLWPLPEGNQDERHWAGGSDLLDDGSFQELDMLARHRAHGMGLEENRPYTDGVITGFGTIDGRRVCVFSQDFTVFGGALGEVFAERSTR